MNTTEQQLRDEYQQILEKLQDPSVFGSPQMATLGRRQMEIEEFIRLYDEQHRLEAHVADLKAHASDPELKELVEMELPEAEKQLEAANEALRLALVPRDPSDSKDVIVEIR